MAEPLDPSVLQLVPPMDLNLGDPEGISPFPLKIRVHNNSRPRVGSVGLFGARRDRSAPSLIATHEGVDLLAPIGTPVFAVQRGTVVNVGSSSVLIEHDVGMRFLTFYQHVQNIIVTNGPVEQGQQIAEVGNFTARDDHLHFEVRYAPDKTATDRGSSLAVDPTAALYQWEKKRFTNAAATRHEVPRGEITELGEIVRGRLLRFLRLRCDTSAELLYIPLINSDDVALADVVRAAFFHGRKVAITWRESLFFNQISFPFDDDTKLAVVAEVLVS